jgi:hypothetical protein
MIHVGTAKIIELELVGWGGEAMADTKAMEIIGEGGSKAMAAAGMVDLE